MYFFFSMKDVSSGSPQNCRSPSSYFDCGSHKALLRKTNLKSLQSPVKATVSHASGKNHVSPFSETCGHGVASSGMRLWQEIETTWTMKINALNSFETSETTDPTTPRHIQEHLNLQQHSCENLTYSTTVVRFSHGILRYAFGVLSV